MVIIPVDHVIVEQTHGSLDGDPLTQLERLEDEADRLWRTNLNIDLNHDQYVTQFVHTHFGDYS